MKPLLLTLLLLIQGIAYANDDNPAIGRYQLRDTRVGLWKTDTVTGQVLVYRSEADVQKDKASGGFLPVDTGKP